MVIYSIPPPHPDEHARHERNRREEGERNARLGRHMKGHGTLSGGDKIIFAVLGVIVLAGLWFLGSWLLG